MRPVNRGNEPVHITSSGTQQPTLSESYSFFMSNLIARLGEYCSFCEVALGANLAIEHIVSKSTDPNLETDWNNFLLACTNCNSRKGTQIQSVQDKLSYYWPDTSYAGFNTFSMLEYYVDRSGTNPVVLVRYRPGSLAYPNPALQTLVDNTIGLVGLNSYDEQDKQKKSDRRVWNRTITWDKAASMVNTLSGYYSRYTNTGNDAQAETDAAADPAIALLKRQITMAALAAGFWSVWMTVFGTTGTFINDTVRAKLLQELFVVPFPGTRYP